MIGWRWFPYAIVMLIVVWFACVIASGYGINWMHAELNFERTGQFGDSFGGVSAIAAGMAAMFAYAAYQATYDENTRLHKRDESRDRADRTRDNELTFFRLCELRNDLVRGIVIPDEIRYEGTAALDEILTYLTVCMRTSGDADGYERGYSRHRNNMGHYFRFTYHLICRVLDMYDTENDRYRCIRMLRAQLSNSEQVLIALNCEYGEGASNFKPLVERYALLHNIDPEDAEHFNLRQLFAPGAFERPASAE